MFLLKQDKTNTLTFNTCICMSTVFPSWQWRVSHWKAARTVRSLSGWVGRKLSPNIPSFPSGSSAPLIWDRSLRNSSIWINKQGNLKWTEPRISNIYIWLTWTNTVIQFAWQKNLQTLKTYNYCWHSDLICVHSFIQSGPGKKTKTYILLFLFDFL